MLISMNTQELAVALNNRNVLDAWSFEQSHFDDDKSPDLLLVPVVHNSKIINKERSNAGDMFFVLTFSEIEKEYDFISDKNIRYARNVVNCHLNQINEPAS